MTDEAHKAAGNHSYVQCVSYLHSFHPHLRIVALTATPGRTTEKVQNIVDALHISRVEIREAEAPEIQRYMFKKVRSLFTLDHDDHY
jgi:ATP-dependent DNA helicase MPH1